MVQSVLDDSKNVWGYSLWSKKVDINDRQKKLHTIKEK